MTQNVAKSIGRWKNLKEKLGDRKPGEMTNCSSRRKEYEKKP